MYCEININDCQNEGDGSPPCLHNGRCIDGIASYSCNCTGTGKKRELLRIRNVRPMTKERKKINGVGFTGTRCETDIDECVENPNICGEHGLCKNELGKYKCECEQNVCGYHCDLYDPCMVSERTKYVW